MEIEFTEAQDTTIDRVYGIDAILRNFKGCQHLEITLFRAGQTAEEMEELKALMAKGVELVGEADPAVPKEVLQGATKEAALTYILENFTRSEVDQFLPYLKKRYNDLVEKVIVAPLSIPVPLGAGSIGALPTTSESGFINFDKAPNYPLPFQVRAYFDFRLQEELSEDQQ
ncbi:MAG: hypothetical protein J5803_04720 [Desulfovibrio sp.]|nr:hypothetical protein [Desulfovibrio sp.]